MSTILSEVLEANAKYSEDFADKGKLAMPPARRFAILTCMDARLDPAKFAGLAEGDAHVIRNAGGRASDDAIRSPVISYKLLGTKEFFVIHHTECGMLYFTNEKIRDARYEPGDGATDGAGISGCRQGAAAEGNYIEWLTFKDARQAVLDDVARIKTHPLIPMTIPVHGYIYDVKTGKLAEVDGAKSVGAG